MREDIRDFRNIRDVELIKLLVELLPDRVGSPLSINSLREDLLKEPKMYLKDEVDFCVLRDRKPFWLIECKSNDTAISPALQTMSEKFPKAKAFQLTLQDIDKINPATQIRLIQTEKFLSMLV